MILWTVRHTKPFNPKDICYGRLDLDVSPSFSNEFQPVLEALQNVKARPNKIYSSPLLRSAKLAQKIAESLKVPIEYAHDIIEVDFGSFEGQKISEIPCDLMAAWKSNLRGYRFPGGESFHDVDARVKRMLLNNFNENSQNEIMWVSHAGVIASVMHLYNNIPDNDFIEGRFHYAMVSRFEFIKEQDEFICKDVQTVFEGLPMKPLDM